MAAWPGCDCPCARPLCRHPARRPRYPGAGRDPNPGPPAPIRPAGRWGPEKFLFSHQRRAAVACRWINSRPFSAQFESCRRRRLEADYCVNNTPPRYLQLPQRFLNSHCCGPRTVPPAWPQPLRRGEGPGRNTIAGGKAQNCSRAPRPSDVAAGGDRPRSGGSIKMCPIAAVRNIQS